MINFNEIYDIVNKLLNNKSISSYKINQDTGIAYNGISELRRGKRQIKNLTIDTIEKLYHYQKSLED
ncbi:helix-turn-helix domain-containing protein [Staphylococcus simiae]|uniref:HTH cro/C1-type domain-containing protein n=1 Tax=Staphylococcus simiae CCM 7213 = CCUG 51256 TaxID=911238 RepID=G5JIN8_9STAP|nr:helix-turn-helix domain-containing protein [Staphylococcus simiae]EHJ07944.1 hypothetical protein SS7213T_06631 [Staphylococcus simiae CCM 7213 = CCUG 51256]PNZ10410.1 hypothetical protein CD113_10290 [Staphylococcus simiae]